MWSQDSWQREPFGERCQLLRLGVTLIAPASQDTCARGMAATWAKLNDIGSDTYNLTAAAGRHSHADTLSLEARRNGT